MERVCSSADDARSCSRSLSSHGNPSGLFGSLLQLFMGSVDPLDAFNPLDPDAFSHESTAVVHFLADYYRNIHSYPVASRVQPGYLHRRIPDAGPYFPHTLDSILDDVKDHIIPGLTHWQSPGFVGYFPATASTAGFLGEMLCSGFNVVGFNWASSPAATELENVVMDWMAKMLQLPDVFLFASRRSGGGVLHGSTCEAVLCTMVAARDKALANMSGEGITRLVVYASDQTHCTVQKAAKIVGIPPSNFRTIATTTRTGYGLSPKAVRSAMDADVANGLIPLYLCATVGTTGLNAVDPLAELGVLCNTYGAWFHVDAAYAGSAAICPEFRQYLDGVELADSVSMNPHKWFLTNMDCCCMWVKDSSRLVEPLSTDPEFLKNRASEEGEVVDYKDWQMALSRRFRAVKLSVVLRRYGVANLREHIRDDVRMAERLEAMVRGDERFEVVGKRRFSLVCFRLRGCGDAENRKLMDEVNNSGKAFLTHAEVEERLFLRMAVGATLTEDRHVDAAWTLIQAKAGEVLRCKTGRS